MCIGIWGLARWFGVTCNLKPSVRGGRSLMKAATACGSLCVLTVKPRPMRSMARDQYSGGNGNLSLRAGSGPEGSRLTADIRRPWDNGAEDECFGKRGNVRSTDDASPFTITMAKVTLIGATGMSGCLPLTQFPQSLRLQKSFSMEGRDGDLSLKEFVRISSILLQPEGLISGSTGRRI